MTYVLTALLALAFGWCWGHLTARVVHVPIGATADEDSAALLADERAQIEALIASHFSDPDARKDHHA